MDLFIHVVAVLLIYIFVHLYFPYIVLYFYWPYRIPTILKSFTVYFQLPCKKLIRGQPNAFFGQLWLNLIGQIWLLLNQYFFRCFGRTFLPIRLLIFNRANSPVQNHLVVFFDQFVLYKIYPSLLYIPNYLLYMTNLLRNLRERIVKIMTKLPFKLLGISILSLRYA